MNAFKKTKAHVAYESVWLAKEVLESLYWVDTCRFADERLTDIWHDLSTACTVLDEIRDEETENETDD